VPPPATVVTRDLVEQPLELADIAVDSLHELAVGAIALADFLERALALHGVELAREHAALAALIAVPELGGRVVVDHARDVDRERIERLDAVARETLVAARGVLSVLARQITGRGRRRRSRLGLIARGAGEEVGQPAAAVAGPRRRGSATAIRRAGPV